MTHSSFFILSPELWLSFLLLILVVFDILWKEESHETVGILSFIGLLPVLFLLGWQSHLGTQETFGGFYRVDSMALFFKGIFTVAALLTILMSRELNRTFERGHGEFYLLILIATVGMFFTASAGNFLMLFVALELITISFYVMTAYIKTDLRSLEAGLKYLVLGALASGFFLYGIAFIYGTTGSIQFSEIRSFVQSHPGLSPGLFFGLLLVLGGILFKATGVPLQLWVPDVYEGAPTPVTAFLSVGSKAAGFVVALRIFHELFLPAASEWTALLAWIAGLTILYGNLCAIPQKNVKRLFGYSSIGHAGYLLIGIATASQLGGAGVTFYLAGYLVTNLAAFLVITAFSRETGSDEIKDYAGLAQRSPLLAATMFLSLLSLAGVPPLAGFFGKFLLLMSAISMGYFWLAIIGAAAVVISLFYYLSIVKTMYADSPDNSTPISVSVPVRCALYTCIVGIVTIGLYQAPFLKLSVKAVQSSF